MAFPIAAVIGAGSQIFSSLLNAGSSRAAVNRAYDNTVALYERQRTDALADRAFENEYNSPAAQMQRLKDAGLNPNLIYGNGGSAVSSSVNTRSSSAPSQPVAQPLQLDLGGAVREFMQIQMMDAQTRQTEANINLINSTAKLRVGQAAYTEALNILTGQKTQTEASKMRGIDLENQLKSATMGANIEHILLENAKLRADTKFTLNQDERNAAMNSVSVKEGLERIIEMKIQHSKSIEETKNLMQVRENLQQDNRIKILDEYLTSIGIDKTEGTFFRIFEEAMQNIGLKGSQNDLSGALKTRRAEQEQYINSWKHKER